MFSSNVDLTKYQPNIIDPESGYSVSIPAVLQMPPFWWEDRPEAYEGVLRVRAANGIEVDDWLGREKPVRTIESEPKLPDWVIEETGRKGS